MANINILVQEELSRSDLSFYDSREDYKNKLKHKLKHKDNPYSRVDDQKEDAASDATGLSRGSTSFLQKMSGNFGGIDKLLGKSNLDSDITSKEAQQIKTKAAKQFNRIMGDNVL